MALARSDGVQPMSAPLNHCENHVSSAPKNWSPLAVCTCARGVLERRTLPRDLLSAERSFPQREWPPEERICSSAVVADSGSPSAASVNQPLSWSSETSGTCARRLLRRGDSWREPRPPRPREPERVSASGGGGGGECEAAAATAAVAADGTA